MSCAGNTSGWQFATQLVGVLAIIGWVTLMMVPFFMLLKVAGVLRVPAEMEQRGLDASEHGGQQAFIGDDFELKSSKVQEQPASDGHAGASVEKGEIQEAR
eukprot:CAMPEP_0171467700 /NCGR_PEP_ID=MMETSP0945-20130129/10145_1 /TAXON_ID=109269 /ORGANISM="Vaucheria litorea, Strain CCMP2940" /LENGTH=100 /DNA_ID=CAMNT_0011996303 /DNA_START=1 /DNA_END=299 /DNA_ORIENTATION=+